MAGYAFSTIYWNMIYFYNDLKTQLFVQEVQKVFKEEVFKQKPEKYVKWMIWEYKWFQNGVLIAEPHFYTKNVQI